MVAAQALACGGESVNVLAPRDAGVDASVEDGVPPIDATVDPPIDSVMDSADPLGDSVIDPVIDPAVDSLTDPSVDPPIGPPTTGCIADGVQCSAAGACCHLSCPNVADGARVCAAGPLCASAGEGCQNNIDCCSDICLSGTCDGVPVDRCRPAGELCTSDSECCGTRCVSLGGGPTRCALLNDCRVQGEICRTHTDCCSGRCDDDQGRRVCMEGPPCGIGGSSCRGQAGDRCIIDGDCCTGACTVRPQEGVRRCVFAACEPQCALCADDRDCCLGRCVGDENGYRRCEN
jgi:hypothetical protein